jgi:hypothetical protein
MATYYKYAERSAESQVNWAEIGKNMTDMLRQEVQVREQKKAALDEATRQAAEQISNAPQGQHVDAKAEAIRLADQASKYLLMQNRLMKQGILDPRDYMIANQNLTDDIRTAYSSMKAFQENYAKLMERAQKDESSMIELKRLEKIQGYGNFRQSGFFIDAPTGKLNVGLKEEQIIDGEKVIGLKKGSSVGMQYIDGAIYGQIDKYKYREPLKEMATSLGKFITSDVTRGTLNSIGYVTSISDARRRIDETKIGSDDKKILYDFYASSFDAIESMLANENHKASILVDAMASKGYFWTDDPDVAAKNPKAVLEVIDPNTGRGVMTFTKEQDQAASEFMMQQFLGMIDITEEQKSTGQIQRQDPSAAVLDRADKIEEAKNFGRQLGTALKSGDDTEVANAIIYLAQKAGKRVNKDGATITISNMDGTGLSTFDLNNDPDKIASSMISAFGTKLPEETILKFTRETYKGNPANITATASGFADEVEEETESPYTTLTNFVDENAAAAIIDVGDTEDEGDVADVLNQSLGSILGAEFKVGNTLANSIYVVVNGKESPNYDVGKGYNADAINKLKKFILNAYAPGASMTERELAAETALADLGILD